MTDKETCPTEATWRAWLESPGEIAVDDESLTQHLDHCQTCQRAVTSLSDRDPFYCLSRETLRSTGLTSHDWPAQAVELNLSDQASIESPAIVSLVQSLLGPTEDECSLGRLGRFEILGVIGSGGMGIVLKGRSVDVDRIVAIKIPQPQYWQSHDTLMTIEREARSAASVVHPNVISIYHVDRYREVPYLVMPYLPGQSLEQRIRDVGPLPIDEAMRIVRQVASALAAAHACGVVHRDVKPANILLGTGTDRVVLSDFGLAKVQSDATCTATGTFSGTPIYLSPEQATGCGAGPAGDVYSLGTVLWTMLCGQPPMSGMHTHAIVRRIADSKIPCLEEHRDDIPTWLARLVSRLHENVPAQRPSADVVVGWVEACQRHLRDERPDSIPEDLRVGKRHLNRWLVFLSVLIAAATIAAVSSFPSTTSSQASRSEVEAPNAKPADNSHRSDTQQAERTNELAVRSLLAAEETQPADDYTAAYLNELKRDLNEINEQDIPHWEHAIQALAEQDE